MTLIDDTVQYHNEEAHCRHRTQARRESQADPFFVTVYDRTYKVDPRFPANEPKGPKPQDVMQVLRSPTARQ